ncbi:protein ITPRID2 isoform 1-T2 [Synchiropus picturatus]
MESTPVEVETSSPSDRGIPLNCSLASLRRQAWVQSKDSTWQETHPEQGTHQAPQQSDKDPTDDTQRPSEKTSHVPNKIASWLIDCRTPLGASLDDQTASPSKVLSHCVKAGAQRNGSFEDDLSLGAEANQLHCTNKKLGSCSSLSLAADEKRSQFKERGRSMNSTGSGKSSTVSSVSELLDLYEEDPEEILLNLGFGRDEPDLSTKVPSRFLNSASSARGIDVKVYLGAQMQRLEVENPNYALTSRFRQLEVLTTVANEFFQLYSQVSGLSVQCINSKDQAEEKKEGGKEASPPPLKKSKSALNAAKLLKKTITKHNLLGGTTQSPVSCPPVKPTQLNGEQKHTNVLANTGSEVEKTGGDANHQCDPVAQKHLARKRDNSVLATVMEESAGVVDDSSLSTTGEHPPESARPVSTSLSKEYQVIKEEEEEAEKEGDGGNLTSTPEKAPFILAPPHLAQLRTENADSFDIEEISNEDEVLLPRSSRNSDLLRTVSQQSDSSGFAEEPSTDSSNLKVQESCESCDSETTVTSHPSQDLATPLALDKPAFELPESKEEELESSTAAEVEHNSAVKVEEVHSDISPVLLQYTSHHLPLNRPNTTDGQLVQTEDQADDKQVTQDEFTQEKTNSTEEPESMQNTASDAEPIHNPLTDSAQNEEQKITTSDTEPSTVPNNIEDEMEDLIFHTPLSTAPASPVLCALNRARRNRSKRGCPQQSETPPYPSRARGVPLQRSSSLPSSLSCPSRVVTSVRIQFGRGETSCSQPCYTIKNAGDETDSDGNKKEEAVHPSNYLSTLIINSSTPSFGSSSQTHPLPESPLSPKPRHLLRSSHSLRSPSPPADWSSMSHNTSWCTQSVPDLSCGPLQSNQFQHGVSNQSQPGLNPGLTMYPAAPFSMYSGYSSGPYQNPCVYPFMAPPQLHQPLLHPYSSLPNLHHNSSATIHSSLSSLHQPSSSSLHQHYSFSSLPQTSPATSSRNSNPQQETPSQHQQGVGHPYAHPSLDTSPSVPGSQFSTPHLGYQGYNLNSWPQFPQTFTPFPSLTPDLHLHGGHTPVGFVPGMSTGFHSVHGSPGVPGPASGAGISSMEMQLRRVLYDIKGTVQGLNQQRVDTDLFGVRADAYSNQVLAEFQQRRRSLCLFRNQMMDLELSLMRQQALVYKQLSPADRLDLEQLQLLRSAVREELQKLEQQLEERMMEFTQLTPNKSFSRDAASADSLSTTSVLRATEPVSDLLREQLLLQSELSLNNLSPAAEHSSRSSSPAPEGGEGVYRASINITPVAPSRPQIRLEKASEQAEESGNEEAGSSEGPVEMAAAANMSEEKLQQLIKEIRESVAKEVRQEIYHQLMAAVLPRQSP